MFANDALLGGGVRVKDGLENKKKDQKKIKGTTKPLMANLEITQSSTRAMSQMPQLIWNLLGIEALIDAQTLKRFDLVCTEIQQT